MQEDEKLGLLGRWCGHANVQKERKQAQQALTENQSCNESKPRMSPSLCIFLSES